MRDGPKRSSVEALLLSRKHTGWLCRHRVFYKGSRFGGGLLACLFD